MSRQGGFKTRPYIYPGPGAIERPCSLCGFGGWPADVPSWCYPESPGRGLFARCCRGTTTNGTRNAVDGCVPSDLAGTSEEIEEERRLLYVAMTKAKDQLDIIVRQRFYVAHQPKLGDRDLYATRTRFIPDSLLSLFERKSWHGDAKISKAEPLGRGLRVDLLPAREHDGLESSDDHLGMTQAAEARSPPAGPV